MNILANIKPNTPYNKFIIGLSKGFNELGHQVAVFNEDSETAFDAARTHRPSLLVVDYEALTAPIKKVIATYSIPTIVFTNHPDTEEIEHCTLLTCCTKDMNDIKYINNIVSDILPQQYAQMQPSDLLLSDLTYISDANVDNVRYIVNGVLPLHDSEIRIKVFHPELIFAHVKMMCGLLPPGSIPVAYKSALWPCCAKYDKNAILNTQISEIISCGKTPIVINPDMSYEAFTEPVKTIKEVCSEVLSLAQVDVVQNM